MKQRLFKYLLFNAKVSNSLINGYGTIIQTKTDTYKELDTKLSRVGRTKKNPATRLLENMECNILI